MEIEIPTSLGDLLDRISILEIKKEEILDSEKLRYVHRELDALYRRISGLDCVRDLESLRSVNRALWKCEEQIRPVEEEWSRLSWAIRRFNDQRYQLKKTINEQYESKIREQKSFDQTSDLIDVPLRSNERDYCDACEDNHR